MSTSKKNPTDNMTFLCCVGRYTKAAKMFTADEEGNVEKKSFSAGKTFSAYEEDVSNIYDVYRVLKHLLNEPGKCCIRGKLKSGISHSVFRRIHGEGAAFDPAPRYWAMFDIDKQEIPDHLDPVEDPEATAEWIRALLPSEFQDVTFVYKFSASQSVPKNLDEEAPSTASLHLVFWCDRPVSDVEWKNFFKANPSPVDLALFNPVQIHYTAAPIFKGMEDPLPVRIGIIEGKRDTVIVPEIPEPEKKAVLTDRPETPPDVSQENMDKAIELLSLYYEEGLRNRLTGAFASALYGGGWLPENVAEFILQLAEANEDDETMSRHDNALRICEAIEDGRPVQGIPTLRDEFEIECLDEILSLLKVGKPDPSDMIEKLTDKSTPAEITKAISCISRLETAERSLFLDRIKEKTRKTKGTLNQILREEVAKNKNEDVGRDLAYSAMEEMLDAYYERGRLLLRGEDGNFWRYDGMKWVNASDDLLRSQLLPFALSFSDGSNGTTSNLMNNALNILKGRVFVDGDPLRQIGDPPTVINCQNGEVWYDKDGECTFKPHRPESYLRHGSDVNYRPDAECPKFKAAMLQIFSESTAPEEMYRHAVEIMGYIFQTWRELAVIVMFQGHGSNGKTSFMNIIQRIIGQHAIMSDRIGDVEKHDFKIGALDGKLLFVDDDVDAGTCLPDGFLKKISERKILTGQHKFKNPFQFICRAVPVLLANAFPSTKDTSYGLVRRMMIVPFNKRFTREEIVPGLFDQIWEEEASGILNEAIAGFQRLIKRGEFDEPEDCVRARKEWLVRSNVLLTFVEEHCIKGADQKQKITEFYKNFCEFCEDNGVRRNIMTLQGVKSRLETMGYDSSVLDGYPVIRGLRAIGWGEADTTGEPTEADEVDDLFPV